MDAVQSTGKLVAGVSFDIPGMGYRNPKTGAIEGFEADLARAIGEKILGSPDRVDFRQVMDEKRVEAVEDGHVDIVLSQMTITPDRAEAVDFSIPYWVTEEGLLVLKGSPIKGLDDLKGKRIAVTAGSISLRRMTATLPSLPGATLIPKPLGIDGLDAVASGEADVVSNDLVNLTMLKDSAEHPDRFEIIDIGDKFDRKPFGAAVKKGRKSLIDLVNPAIESLKASGVIDRIMNENVARFASGGF